MNTRPSYYQTNRGQGGGAVKDGGWVETGIKGLETWRRRVGGVVGDVAGGRGADGRGWLAAW